MKRAEREQLAQQIVYSARNLWPVFPTRLVDGRVLMHPGGPELTIEALAGLAYTERKSDGRPPGGGWIPPVEALRDAVAVLRGLAEPVNDGGPREANAGTDVSAADMTDQVNSEVDSTAPRLVGGQLDRDIDAAVRRHPAGKRRRDGGDR